MSHSHVFHHFQQLTHTHCDILTDCLIANDTRVVCYTWLLAEAIGNTDARVENVTRDNTVFKTIKLI